MDKVNIEIEIKDEQIDYWLCGAFCNRVWWGY